MATGSEKPGKAGLYLFGIAEICLGLLFALLSMVFFFLPKPISPNPPMPMPNVWPISLMEFVFACGIITLGVGTFMAKRWARKIVLILSWVVLAAGLLDIILFVFFMGSFFDNAFGSAPNITPATASGIKIAMFAMIGFFFVILPGIFVLFYQSKYALAAVEYYDPQENWMDACPTPVFGVSLLSALGAIVMVVFGLIMLCSNIPLYTAIYPVWAIVLYLLVMFTALTYISIGFYHLDIKAWWVAVLLVTVCSVFIIFMFKTMDPLAMYQKMNVPAEQIEQIKKTGMLDMYKSMSNIGWLMLIPYLGYLLFIRKYFLVKESKKSRKTA